jgi:chlorophyll synthase
VIVLILLHGHLLIAAIVSALLAIQAICMIRLVRDPVRHAVWYSAIGVGLYVLGMLASAFALAAIVPSAAAGS